MDEPEATLAIDELARAARVPLAEAEEIRAHGFLEPDEAGRHRPSDIQRIRAVMAMRSSGLSLDQLDPLFASGFFTLQPMDMFYPRPSPVTDQTLAQLAQELGIDTDELLRIVIAAGFPAPSPNEPLREDDARLAGMLVEAGRKLGGGDILLRTARVYGEATRRAAEASIAFFDEGVNQPLRRESGEMTVIDDAVRAEMNELALGLMQLAEEMIAGLFRRHLEHAMLGSWAAGAEQALDLLGLRPLATSSPGLAFVDLAGYSGVTEASGDTVAMSMAARLAELAELSTSRHHGRVVKLLGDGAMLHFREPLDAARGALHLVGAIGESDLPAARGGVHAGTVIERDGDFFGRTVNVAARVAAEARPGQVLVSDAIAELPAHDLGFASLGPRELKGTGTVALYEVRPARAQ